MAPLDVTEVLRAYGRLDDGKGPVAAENLPVSPLSGGLINHTLAVGDLFILQRLHPIFAKEVNLDIAALLPVLAQGGVPVPQIVSASNGLPYVIAQAVSPTVGQPEASPAVWRLLTRLPGETLHRLQTPAQAQAAGAMVARFHTALLTCPHQFHFRRAGAHDTDLHLQKLLQALVAFPDHPLHSQVGPLAEELAVRWAAWGQIPALPERIIHGDLKVSNLLWQGDAVCGVIDLDTMARSSLDIELGDALRSWCNTGTEDDDAPTFSAATFSAAMQGYLSVAGSWITPQERAAVAPGVERICLELAMRFAGDALREDYFGWDPSRFASRGLHNLARARNQLGLARDVAAKRALLAG